MLFCTDIVLYSYNDKERVILQGKHVFKDVRKRYIEYIPIIIV